METIEMLKDIGVDTIGFCYYHEHDLGRAADPETRNLYLGFDSAKEWGSERVISILSVLKENKKSFWKFW